METVASAAIRQLLRERRQVLNSGFVQARVNYPQLNGDAFLEHVRDTLVPVLERVQSHDATRTMVVLESLYAISLRSVAQGLMGPNARSRVVEPAWRRLLESSLAFLCREPTLIATSLANALVQLAEIDADTVARWQQGMSGLVPHAKTAHEWLDAGLVLAWRSGLPHYRESALAKARKLDRHLGSVALGLDPREYTLDQDAYDRLLTRMLAQPWLTPQEHLSSAPSQPELKVIGWLSGFVGFGGHFATPPRVFAQGERLLLSDDEKAWYLAADCFGMLLKREDRVATATLEPVASPIKLARNGVVASQYGEWKVDAAKEAVSHAANATTLVVVPQHSHRALVLGLRLPRVNL